MQCTYRRSNCNVVIEDQRQCSYALVIFTVPPRHPIRKRLSNFWEYKLNRFLVVTFEVFIQFNLFVCLNVAICDPVHDVETIHGLF